MGGACVDNELSVITVGPLDNKGVGPEFTEEVEQFEGSV